MAKKNRNILKSYFETGDTPTEGQYVDLIDSFAILNSENTGSLDLKGNITADTFFGDGSQLTGITSSQVNVTGVTASFSTGSLLISGNLYYSSGSTNVLLGIRTTGSIIPGGNNIWDLGSPTQYFRSAYTNDIYAVNVKTTNINATNDITASGNISASGTLDITGNVNFDGNLDVDGTTNLDVVDIDGAVDMASTLVVASHITSSGNISASGTIIASNLSGTNTGDQNLVHLAVTGSDVIFGNITASGEISASGNIYAKSLYISGSKRILFSDSVGGGNNLVVADSGLVVLGILAGTNITASGEISASGNVLADKVFIGGQSSFQITDDGNAVMIPGPFKTEQISGSAISSSGRITGQHFYNNKGSVIFNDNNSINIFSNDTTRTRIKGSALYLGENNTGAIEVSSSITSSYDIKLIGGDRTITSANFVGALTGNSTGLSGTPSISVTNITASGNISASGTIKGLDYEIGNRKFANASVVDSNGIELGNGGTGNLLLTNLTASGEISASGNIITAGNIITDQITASSNVSVSGDIIATGNVNATSFTGIFNGALSSSNQISTNISGAFTSTSASIADDVASNLVSITTNASNISTLNSSGLLSGSAQIASNISGAFTTTSASIATDVASNLSSINTNTAAISTLNSSGLLSSSAQVASNISGAFTTTSASIALDIVNNAADTFKSTGQRNGNSFITGSLHLTGSTSDLRVDGTVGIGTAAPTTNNVMMHIKSIEGLDDPTVIIEAGGINDNASIQLKNQDVNWELQNQGAGYSDSFLIRDTSTSLYPFVLDPSAAGNGTHPLFYLKGEKVSILAKTNDTTSTNLLVSGNMTLLGPNGHITASGNISSSGKLIIPDVRSTNIYAISDNASGINVSTNDISIQDTGENVLAEFKNNQILFHQNITASGNIKSTGNVNAVSFTGIFNGALSSSAQIASNISGAFTTTSASIATDIASNLSSISTLTSNVSGAFTLTSASIASDIASNIVNISNLPTSESVSGSFLLNTTDTLTGNLTVTGTGSFAGGIDLEDNQYINIGTGNDLSIYHDGSNSYIKDNGTGFLFIQADNSIVLESTSGENYFKGDINGAVKLYFDNTEKFTTTTDGINVTGQITASSHISSSGTLLANKGVFGTDAPEQPRVIINSTGHITASANISASGTIIASNLSGTNTGDQDLGTYMLSANTASFAVTSSNVLFGNITASSNISASGNLIGNQLIIGGGTFTSASLAAGGGGSADNLGNHTATQDLNLGGNDIKNVDHITASGNISASGNVIADKVDAGLVSDLSANFEIRAGQGGIATLGEINSVGLTNSSTYVGGGRMTLSGASSFISTPSYVSASRLISETDITASGTITASFIDAANEFKAGGKSAAALDGGILKIGSETGLPIQIGRDSTNYLTITGPITASSNIYAVGNISSSATGSFSDGRFTNKVGIGTTSPGDELEVVGDISASGDIFADNFRLVDNGQIKFGNSNDLTIKHDGTNSQIYDSGAGNLQIRTSTLQVRNESNNETMISAVQDAAVSLYYDNSLKLATTSTGVDITGQITASGNISSSGNVLGNYFYSNEAAALGFTGGTMYLGNALYPTEIDGTNIKLDAPVTASGNVSSSNASTASFGSMKLTNLPTTKPTTTGSLWLSGSAGQGSKFLVVFTG